MPAIMPPPRLIHNQKLAREWLAKHSIVSAFPKISEQLPVLLVNRHALFPGGYNPSLIRYDNRWLMSYRWHPDHTARSALAIAELDETFNVVRNEQLHCTTPNVEDARFFLHNGLLWASYIESKWPDQLKSIVKYGRVTNDGGLWKIEQPLQVKYGRNDGEHTEKNWAFWERQGKLMCLYQCSPEQIVLEIEGENVIAEHKSDSPRWKFGPIKSGVAPMPHEGEYVRFFHSRLNNEPAPYSWRYYLGVSRMTSEPPFATTEVNQEPLARGSEIDDLNDTERSGCPHRKPNVIFPAGCVIYNERAIISCGINDAESALIRIKI